MAIEIRNRNTVAMVGGQRQLRVIKEGEELELDSKGMSRFYEKNFYNSPFAPPLLPYMPFLRSNTQPTTIYQKHKRETQ